MSAAKPDAWMPLYIGDWDGDTGHLDCEQDGAYGRLIRYYWRAGPPPDDDATLARIVRMELRRWRKVRPAIAPFFQVAEGLWRHKRVDAERPKWAAKKAKSSEKAKAAADARWTPRPKPLGNAPGRPQASPKQSPSSREIGTLEVPISSDTKAYERELGMAAQRARDDLLRLGRSDPDGASSLAEFIAYCDETRAELRRSRLGIPA